MGLIVFCVLQILDAYTTWLAVSRGKGHEGNPVVQFFIDMFGLVPGLVFIKAALIAAAWNLDNSPDWVWLSLSAFYAYVITKNMKIANT